MTVYLDHAATTPILPEAAAAMTARLGSVGNPNSLHASGRAARRVVEESRETVARALGCRPSEVVFTSGGTESDNLALKGLFWARHREDPRRTRVLSTTVEHHAVLDALEWLGEEGGAEVVLCPVDRLGRLDVEAFRAAVESDPDSVALVSVMWANNEVGTVQPIGEVVSIAHAHGIPVHTDAVQAVGQVPVDFAASGVDAMTLTGHKIGGPYGVGSRMKIAYTRAMITAALSGALANVAYTRHPVFNIDVPRSCPGVPESVLDPRSTWPDPAKYDEQARKLAQMFVDNFKAFERDVAPSVKEAGPKV